MTARPVRRPHGRRQRGEGGIWTFVPEALPPPFEWTARLVGELSAADRAVGRLAGVGRRLPNPQLLIRPFVRREAVLSSRIEGTRTTVGELFAAEAGGYASGDPEDLREVANYVAALEYGVNRLRDLPLSLRLVRELHEKLMSGVRGEIATPGHFRRSQNWIGRAGCTPANATYVPPPPELLTECLGAWERFLHDRSLPPLVHAAVIHSQFEAIHPFLDGNGRVGRLLITLLLLEREILPSPLLYLSAFFEAEREEYYSRLLGVTARGEWEEWIAYFLRGVAEQASDALARIVRLEDLLANARQRLDHSLSKVPERALELFTENPYATVGGVAQRLGVAFTTAQRAMDRLEAEGIVARVSDARRNRLYVAQAVLEILEM